MTVPSATEPGGNGRLRITHVVRQFHPNRGGLEDVVANLGREQVGLGCDVRVVTCDRLFTNPGETLPATDTLDGIAIRRIPWRGSPRYPIAPGFLSAIRSADLVHVHGIDFFFDALALTRPLHGIPLVATTHGGFFHTGAHAGLKRLWFNGPTRLSATAYRAIVGCGANDTQLFARIAPGRVRTIENGVDIRKFRDAASPDPAKRIVTLGRFSDNKRLDRLLAATRELVRRDPAWRLAVIGVESDWTRATLDAAIAEHGLTEAVSVHIGPDDAEIRRLIGAASFFASASDYEGFGLALIEALAAGLSAIVHPNGSFADLARRHPEIRLADFSDPADAAAAIESAWSDRVAGPRPTPALERYSWRGVADRYDEVYRAALTVRRPAAGPAPRSLA